MVLRFCILRLSETSLLLPAGKKNKKIKNNSPFPCVLISEIIINIYAAKEPPVPKGLRLRRIEPFD